jgi:hypothetical protein
MLLYHERWLGSIFFIIKYMRITPFLTFNTLTFSIALLSFGCSKEKPVTTGLDGHYINRTFLEASRDSVPGLIGNYCHELNFVSKDSVLIFYGFEEALFSYEKSGDKYLIKNGLRDKDMPFSIDRYHHLILEDSSWTKSNVNSIFTKSIPPANVKWSFVTELNKMMIAGSYTLFDGEMPTKSQVTLSPDGRVDGLADFTNYELCFSGDCVYEVTPVSNNITFSNGKDSSVVFAVKFGQRTRFKLYNIEKPAEDIKGEREIKDLAFDFR